ncbi:MAG: aminotransferase class I/II-fold pyridoxal phosphate-dependent enzyme [Nitrococcus mobilis]|nr:aminotransferase class I/II-fold pyridoxal phosphate-dependent enzyme [Nitrococcus mobilis]
MALPIRSKLPHLGTTIFSVMSQRALECGAINLSQGFPDFPVPARLRTLLAEAVHAGHNQYAPLAGEPMLREAIAAKVRSLYGCTLDSHAAITVTSGATEALFAAICAVVRAGDEVIVFDPAYDAYEPAVTLAGGHVRHLPLCPPDFRVDWDRVRDALTAHTRLIILNSPHNPTGAVFEATDLEALAQITQNADVLLLADEVYEHIVFDRYQHQSLLRHAELAARSFVVSSFGKTYHCTGWKVGYCIAPPLLTAELRKVHQYLTFSTMTPAQHAFARFMAEEPEHYRQLPAFYQAKRDYFCAMLQRSRFRFTPARGTYFQLLDYSELATCDDVEYADQLIANAGVASIPISVFYQHPPPQQRLLRFCFAKAEPTLEQAGARLCAL